MKRSLVTAAFMFVLGVALERLGAGSVLWIAGAVSGVNVANRIIDDAILGGDENAFFSKRGNQLIAAVGTGALGVAAIAVITASGANDNWLWLALKFAGSLFCGAAVEAFLHKDPRDGYARWSAGAHDPIIKA